MDDNGYGHNPTPHSSTALAATDSLAGLSQIQLQKSQEEYQKIPILHKKIPNLWWCSIKSERH